MLVVRLGDELEQGRDEECLWVDLAVVVRKRLSRVD